MPGNYSLKLEMKSGLTVAVGSWNDTIWEEYIDIAFLVANCSILLITSIVGIMANLFVVWAVYHQKSLQTWNNAMLVNLAIIDILRCAVDCPILFTIVTTVHQRGRVDELTCNAQVVTFSFGCCIQLLTLACISAERYQAIAHPFKSVQRRKRIMVLIPLIWTLAILVAILCLTFVKDSPVYVKCNGTRLGTMYSYDTFGLYVLAPLWIACFVLITGFYTRIFTIVRAHRRKIFDKGSVPLSKKEKTKDTTDEQNEKEDKGGEKGQSESEQNQTQRQTVAQVQQVIQAEPNSSNIDLVVVQGSPKLSESKTDLKATVRLPESTHDKSHPKVQQAEPNASHKDSTALLLSSTKVTKGSLKNTGNKNDTKAQVIMEALFPGVEQAIPHVKQVQPSTSSKDLTVSLLNVTEKSMGILTNSDTKIKSTATVHRDEAPSGKEGSQLQVMQVHPKLSRKDKPVEVGLRTLVKEAQSSLDDKNELKQKEESPFDLQQHLVVQIEPKSSSQVTVADLMSPATEGQSIFKKESGDKVHIEKELCETKGPRPDSASAPQANGTVCSSVSLISSEQFKDDIGREVFVVSAFPQAQANHTSEVSSAEVDGAVCMMPSLGNKERVNKSTESKMAKRSGYIIFTFLLFWLPLITTILLNFGGHQNRRYGMTMVLNVEVLSVSVACMTSLSDPIIYAAVNPQFRAEFYRLRNQWKSSFLK